jgi:hypothetical protein
MINNILCFVWQDNNTVLGLIVTSLAGLLSQGSLAKGVPGSVQAYREEGGNAQL